MLKFLTLTFAAGAMFALLAVNANALPVTPSKQVDVGSTVTLVRDDCGRGRHFSRSRGHCVRDERTFRDDCGRGRHFSRSRGHCVRDERAFRDDCGRGRHFSRSRGHCVRNDANSDARAIGTILSIIGGSNHRSNHNNHNNHDNHSNNNHKNNNNHHSNQSSSNNNNPRN